MDRVDFSDLFMALEDSDVELRLVNEGCGQNLTFPAHRIVLTRASVMFKSMLEDDKCDVKDEYQKPFLELRVKGKLTSSIAFARYFYTKKLQNLVVEDYITLMKTADLYQITHLFTLCETEIRYRLRPNNVCEVYESLEKTASKNFISDCLYQMIAFAFIIFTENHHLILEKSTMKVLLESDGLNVLDENQALAALVSWGETRCAFKDTGDGENVTEIVTKLFPLIRWRFVKGDDKLSSWIDMAKEKKLLETDSVLRESKTKISLVLFAEILSMSKMRKVNEMSQFRDPGTYNLLLFTANKNVLLIALTLDIIRLKKTLWNQDLQLFCNKKDLTAMVKSARVSKYGFTVKCGVVPNEIYTYRVEIEFVTPILLKKCHLNLIEAKVNTGHDVAFPEFSLNSLNFPLWSTNQDSLFSFHSKVLSLQSLHYFNTS